MSYRIQWRYTFAMKIKTFRQHWLEADRATREQWAAKIGTSYKYLQKLSAADGKFGTPSVEFALKVHKAIPGVNIKPWLPKGVNV